MSVRPLHIAQLTAVVAGALLLLSACGGSASSSSDATSAPAVAAASSPAAGGADMTAYRDCMAANGVTLPEGGARPSGAPSDRPTGPRPSGGTAGGGGGFPGGLPDGVDQATFDAARTACASLQPQGGGFGGQRGGPQMDATATAAFKSCLTDHAVTVPDSDNWMAELDRSDPTVQSAIQTCSPLLPTPSSSPTASPAS